MDTSRLVDALVPDDAASTDEARAANILHQFHSFMLAENRRMEEAARLGIIAPEPDISASVIMPNIHGLARTELVDPVAYFVSAASTIHAMAMNTLAFSAQCMMVRNPAQEQGAANALLGYVELTNNNFNLLISHLTGNAGNKSSSGLVDVSGHRLIQ